MSKYGYNISRSYTDRKTHIHNFKRFGTVVITVLGIVIAGAQQSKAAPSPFYDTAIFFNSQSMPDINVGANRWYKGGTLHRATYRQWSRATARDRLATAGDWAAAVLGVEGVTPIGMAGLKVYATAIVTCVNNARTQQVMDNQVSEFAAVCMIMMEMR